MCLHLLQVSLRVTQVRCHRRLRLLCQARHQHLFLRQNLLGFLPVNLLVPQRMYQLNNHLGLLLEAQLYFLLINRHQIPVHLRVVCQQVNRQEFLLRSRALDPQAFQLHNLAHSQLKHRALYQHRFRVGLQLRCLLRVQVVSRQENQRSNRHHVLLLFHRTHQVEFLVLTRLRHHQWNLLRLQQISHRIFQVVVHRGSQRLIHLIVLLLLPAMHHRANQQISQEYQPVVQVEHPLAVLLLIHLLHRLECLRYLRRHCLLLSRLVCHCCHHRNRLQSLQLSQLVCLLLNLAEPLLLYQVISPLVLLLRCRQVCLLEFPVLLQVACQRQFHLVFLLVVLPLIHR